MASKTPKEIETILIEELKNTKKPVSSAEFSERIKVDQNVVVGIIKSLESKEIVKTTFVKGRDFLLLPKGKETLEKGSYECRFLSAMPNDANGILKNSLEKKLGKETFSEGYKEAMKLKLCRIEKTNEGIKIFRIKGEIEKDLNRERLLKVFPERGERDEKDIDFENNINILKKKKLIKAIKKNYFNITLCNVDQKETVSTLTPEMIINKTWKDKNFKKYNLEAKGIAPDFGCLHPLLKVREEFKEVLLSMGFEEMRTNEYVESSFWNFDSLFQPQQHPARDLHDTFFIQTPKESLSEEWNEYSERVKAMHESGDNSKSIGWRYKWSKDEARKNVLRTHTTASSSKTLFKIAQEKEFKPRKLFSIDRVFRNETLDATHLAEFHQVEGFVVDKGLSLGDLLGTVAEFFRRIGISNVRFKPAYNPYTEPSMEIFGYSQELKKWIEVGNSGIFRPEMLLPMGFDEDVTAIAWGLSLERPTMIKYGVSNIRQLFGNKMDLEGVRAKPEVMFACESDK